MKIKPCTGCDACRRKDQKDCILRDDMTPLYSKLRKADAIVMATPVYWFTVSAQTKLFMDRWYAMGGEAGYPLKGKGLASSLPMRTKTLFVQGQSMPCGRSRMPSDTWVRNRGHGLWECQESRGNQEK